LSAVSDHGYLDHYLEPVRRHIAFDDVTDVYINRPGELWIERLGGAVERTPAPEITDDHLWRLAQQVAALSHQGVNRRHPVLAAVLPDGVRVQVVAPPATRGHVAVAFRRHVARRLSLRSYEEDRPASDPDAPGARSPAALDEHAAIACLLEAAVAGRKNILISGGTSTGKTTLLNTLLGYVPDEERIITIEDTPELQILQPNSVGLIAVRGSAGEAQVTTLDLLESALRMRPDRILLGELRGPEAFTFLRAINTGHPGSMTTIHADSPQGAMRQLAMMALQANLGIQYDDLLGLVTKMVDLVVQLERVGGRRRIARALVPPPA
jgi:type IV secretion system protein VirB11